MKPLIGVTPISLLISLLTCYGIWYLGTKIIYFNQVLYIKKLIDFLYSTFGRFLVFYILHSKKYLDPKSFEFTDHYHFY